jgi:uncharacterized protein
MLIQKETNEAKVVIKAYQAGEIRLNIGCFNQVIFLADGEKKDFDGASRFEQLQFSDFKFDSQNLPEILIIGTGESHQILAKEIVSQINALGIAVEAMASRQACHTYQVLIHDKRQIYALIFP